jgi:hypothetical protein
MYLTETPFKINIYEDSNGNICRISGFQGGENEGICHVVAAPCRLIEIIFKPEDSHFN